jgi:hypothetical protein
VSLTHTTKTRTRQINVFLRHVIMLKGAHKGWVIDRNGTTTTNPQEYSEVLWHSSCEWSAIEGLERGNTITNKTSTKNLLKNINIFKLNKATINGFVTNPNITHFPGP